MNTFIESRLNSYFARTELDSISLLRDLIKNDLELVKELKQAINNLEDNYTPEFDLLWSNIVFYEEKIFFSKRILRSQLLRFKKLKINFVKLIEQGCLSSIVHHGASRFENISYESKYFDYIAKMLYIDYNDYCERMRLRSLTQQTFRLSNLSKKVNIFTVLDVEQTPDIDFDDELEEGCNVSEVIGKNKDKLKKDFDFDFNDDYLYVDERYKIDEPAIERDVILLRKLRYLISLFRERRSSLVSKFFRKFNNLKYPIYKLYKDYLKINVTEASSDIPLQDLTFDSCNIPEYLPMPEDPQKSVYNPEMGAPAKIEFGVEAQMERESKEGDCNLIKEDKKENVVLTTHAEESIAKPVTIGVDNWEKLCSSQAYQAYDIMQRWQKYKVLLWTSDDQQDHQLFDVRLPFDFIKDKSDSPSCILFKTYAYCRFDMEVKIQINTNKFTCGALQASFYYGGDDDSYYADRKNVACASQMTHCVLDAAAASDGVLKIPFRYYKPLLSTRSIEDDSVSLVLGNLRLFVLNPLKSSSKDKIKVDVSMFVRFVNPRFHGMISRDIGAFTVESQMFSPDSIKNSIKGVESMLNYVFPDEQRDNPTDPSPANYIMPQNAASWCLGDIVPEKLNPLRLQACGTTPHPPGTIPEEPEMQLSYIQSVYGLVNTYTWSVNDQAGKILKVLPFSPVLATADYMEQDCNNGAARTCQVMPPIGILAELFAYWRGSIDYRIDFVCTQFHTGRLILAYVPRIDALGSPTLDQLTACDHIIIDIRDNKQYQFINRFLSDKPWWPRRRNDKSSTEAYPPGHIYIAVLNTLTAASNTVDNIEFNLYMRGASDFELHIPVNPHIGLSYNTQIIQRNSSTETYVANYGPPQEQIYVGGWHSLNPSNGQCAMFRYGPGSDHVTQFNEPKGNLANIRTFKRVYTLVGTPGDIVFIDSTGATVNANYMVLIPPSYALSATKYWYGAAFNSPKVATEFAKTIDFDKKNPGYFTYDVTKLGKSAADGPYSKRTDTIYWEAYENVNEGFEFIENQMEDERKFVCGDTVSLHPPVSSTWNGLLTFGEQITSIKQLVRRYQPYSMTALQRSSNNPSLADIRLPLLPQGLDLDLSEDYGNQARDGLIPILLSGYRFYRGGMRLKLVVSDNSNSTSRHIWVMHKCDEKLMSLHADTQLGPNNISNRFTSGYASYIQNLQTNSVVSLEIPFYLPVQFGLLQRPNLKRVQDAPHYSLGNLYCGIDYGSKAGTATPTLLTFYSLTDDFRASVFQGFPPVFRLTEFMPTIENQSDEEKSESWLGSWKNSISGYISNKKEEIVTASVNKGLDEFRAKLTQDADFTAVFESLTKEMDDGKKIVVFSALSNVFHAIISPTWSTIAWSIASFFVTIGVLTINYLYKVFEYLKDIIKRLFSKRQDSPRSETNDRGLVESQAPVEDHTDAAFVSTMVVGALSLMGAKDKPLPRNLPDFSKYLYDGVPKFTMTANGLFTFFKNNLKMIKNIFSWVVSYLRPEATLNNELSNSDEDVLAYMRMINWCLSAENEKKIQVDMQAQLQVYMCANAAQVLLAKMAVSSLAKPMPVFTRMLYKIIDLRDKLAREFASPPVRYEPFTFCLVGPSKIGKSHMVSRIISDMIKSINYKTYDELIYVRTPGNSYWNNLRGQVACLFDDFLCLQDPVFGMQQVAELFCLKSTAVFNPPKAAIEEKNIRYNPLIVAMCTNVPFPVVSGVADNNAFWRRRDILIHAQAKKQYIGKDPRTLPKEVTKDYGHLEFRIYKDSTKEGFVQKEGGDWILSYGELNSYLIEQHHNYHDSEVKQYQNRLEELQKHYPVDTNMTLRENIEKMELFIKNMYTDTSNSVKETTKRLKELGDPLTALVEKKKKEFVQKAEEPVFGAIKTDDKKFVDYLTLLHYADGYEPTAEEEEKFNKLSPRTFSEIKKVRREALASSEQSTSNVVAQSGEEFETCLCLQKPLECQFMQNSTVISYGDLDDIKTFTLGMCSESCVIVKAKRGTPIAKYIKNKIMPEWIKRRYPLEKMPPNLQLLCDVTSTPRDVMDRIDEEVEAGKKWYEKFLDKLPSFSTTIRFLSKILATLVVVWGIVKAGAALFNIGNVVETANNISTTEKLNSETWLTDAKNVNQTVTKLWTEDRSKMENEVFKMFCAPSTDQMPASGSVNTVGKSKGNPAPIKNFVVSQSSTELHNVIYDKIKRNTFWICVEYFDDNIFRSLNMRCLGICGRRFLLLDHYDNYCLLKLKYNNAKFYIIMANTKLEFDYNEIKKMFSKDSAIVIGTVPKQIPAFANIVKFIAPAHVHANLPVGAVLVETDYDVSHNNTVQRMHHFDRIVIQDRLRVTNDDDTYTNVNKVYVYPKSQKGLCGSVLVSSANLLQPIIGIHIAGVRAGMSGYAEALTQESFSGFAAEVISANVDIDAQLGIEGAKMLPDTNVVFVGVVKPEMAIRPPHDSRLVKTECHNAITISTMEPAILNAKDPRIAENPYSPLFEGIRNHGLPPLSFPEREVVNAVQDLRNQLLAVVKPCRMKIGVLPVEQAIVGIEHLTNYEALDMKTSEGYPLVKKRPKGCTNKEWLFDLEPMQNGFKLKGIHPELIQLLDYKQAIREKGEIPTTIFTACLKDCKLPKDKVTKPGKTRIFSISPVDFTIQQRQYFMDFSVAYQEARFAAEHAIGIDIKSTEVKDLVNRLLDNAPNLITGDYSKFGDQLMSTCVYYVYDIIADWYRYNGDTSQENYNMRMIFCEEVMHARILAYNTIYQNLCGMPSGNPLTVVINSMVNSLYTRIVWQLIMKEKAPEFYSLASFHHYTERCFYGDDLIMSVKSEVLELYNTATMSEMFSRYKIKFTDSSKSEDIVKYCRIGDDNASFLKHTFYPHPTRYGEWLAKLDFNAAHETCNWTWNTNRDLRASSIEACVSMMEELYGYGEEHYEEIRHRIIMYWRSKFVDIKIPTWYELDLRIFGVI